MDALRIAMDAALAAGLGLAVGIAGYLVSFALMVRHTAPRHFTAAIREIARELFWVVLTQPIAPLWYFVGRRLGRGTGHVPIVFVHGYMQNRIDFVWIARRLRRANVGSMHALNYPWMASIRSNAARLARFVEAVRRETGAEYVDVVCHSMGGLIATEYMQREGHAVRRCVTIASPHAGIMWRGPVLGAGAAQLRRGSKFLARSSGAKLEVPTLSIYSTHDNIVHPPETAALAHRGGVDEIVEGVGHFAILFSSRVEERIAAFLGEAKEGEAPAPADLKNV